MMIILIISILLTAGYVTLMLLYHRGWAMQPSFTSNGSLEPKTKVSIIVPARNEELNIATCVRSALQQNYPPHLLEVIVVDDHSDDNTAAVVNTFNDERVKCIRLAEHIVQDDKIVAFKKLGLSIGIAQSKGELIITTDADCFAGPDWIKDIVALYEQQHPVMIVAPVDFTADGSVVQTFQSIDFMSMQGITAAAHKLNMGNMSNGANLAFSREAYNAVDGYKGIDHLASGDDYLLMMKLKQKFPARIAYLKSQDAIVHTAPQPDWAGFLQQRIRWASKSGKYDDKTLTSVLLLVYIFNFSFLVLLIAGFANSRYWLLALAMVLIKTIAELVYLFPVARFFNKQRQLRYYLFLQPLHIVYIIAAGFLGFFGVYRWKGRKVK